MSNLNSLEDTWLYAAPSSDKRNPRPGSYLLSLAIFVGLLVFGVVQQDDPEIKLGLDLRGGTTIVLQPEQIEEGKITPEAISQAVEILRQRVDGVGVAESEIRAEGAGSSTKIIVSVPGASRRELVDLVGQTAKLSIRPVLFVGNDSAAIEFPPYLEKQDVDAFLFKRCSQEATSASDDISSSLIACDESGSAKYILGPTKVEGSQISDAQFSLDQGALGWVTNLSFDGDGKKFFGELSSSITTLAPPRNQIAIVLDGKVVVAPRVDGPLNAGQVRIYGSFTQEYAKNLANVLKYGALPFSFRVDEVDNVSASLGASQLRSGLSAGALGLLLISLYLLFFYRALGLLAIGSLAIAFAITLLIFILLGSAIGLTLTLAGIAGAIVSIGVTADSFIVYFERVKDEMRLGASLRVSLERGWLRAKRTVWIADAVSLIAALILYIFTTGNVRGFAFTLGLTTLIDLLIVYFFTRPTLVLLERVTFFAKGHQLSGLSQASLGIITRTSKRRLLDLGALGGRLFRGEVSIDVVQRPRKWFMLSGVTMLFSVLTLATMGLNLGLEFKGGTVNVVSAPTADAEKARLILNQIGYQGQSIIQEIGDSKIRIETDQLSNDKAIELANALSAEFGVDVSSIDSRSIGPSWGAEISRNALLGIFWFIVILIIYLAFALEIRMALAAIVAVVHDLLITVGIYATMGLKVTPAAVIGFLTILGYSLYDTVVVFDKVRENVRAIKRRSEQEYAKAVNLALNQTLIRSINTSIVAVIPIASILVVGAIFLEAETLKDISLALVIGQSIGTYSSIFIAAPLLVKLNVKNFSKQSSATLVDELFTNSTRPRNEKLQSKPLTRVYDYVISQLELSDGPDIFRTFHSDSQAWLTLWAKQPVPESLEELIAILKIENISANEDNYTTLIIRKDDSMNVVALLRAQRDLTNSTQTIDLLALSSMEKSHEFAKFVSSYLAEIQSAGEFAIFRLPSFHEPTAFLSSGLELAGRISDSVLKRDGRLDHLILQSRAKVQNFE